MPNEKQQKRKIEDSAKVRRRTKISNESVNNNSAYQDVQSSNNHESVNVSI